MRTDNDERQTRDVPSQLLLVYSTTHGHTEKIAGHITDALEGQGVDGRLLLAGRHVPFAPPPVGHSLGGGIAMQFAYLFPGS